MMRNEFLSFQKELYSRDWKDFCGTAPSLTQFQAFNKWKLKELNQGRHEGNIAFEDYMLFQRELRTNEWREIFGTEPTFDDYAQFKRLHTSMAFFFYLGHFRRKPSFECYLQYEKAKKRFNWSDIQCPVPTFEDYVKFLVEKDNVSFDWEKAIGRMPRLEEYMLYADAIKDLDKETRALPQFSFRAVLEQGMDSDPTTASNRREESSKAPQRRYRSPSPQRQSSPPPAQRRRTRSPSPFRHNKKPRPRSPGRTRFEDSTGYKIVHQYNPVKVNTAMGSASTKQATLPQATPMVSSTGFNPNNPTSSSEAFPDVSKNVLKDIVSRFKSTVSQSDGAAGQNVPVHPQTPTPLISSASALGINMAHNQHPSSGFQNTFTQPTGAEGQNATVHPQAPMSYMPSVPAVHNNMSQNQHQTPRYQNYSEPVGHPNFVPPRHNAPAVNPPPFPPHGGASSRPGVPFTPQGPPRSLMAIETVPHALPPNTNPDYMLEPQNNSAMGTFQQDPCGQSNRTNLKKNVRQKHNKKYQLCIFPECTFKHATGERQLFNHLGRSHLTPFVFYEELPIPVNVKVRLLCFLKHLADTKNIPTEVSGTGNHVMRAQELVNFMAANRVHRCEEDCAISEEHFKLVTAFHCRINDPLPVDEINVHEPNCVAALIWWRNVVDLLQTMTVKQRATVRCKFAQRNWNRSITDPEYKSDENTTKGKCVFPDCHYSDSGAEKLYRHLGQEHFTKAIFAKEKELRGGKKRKLFAFLKCLARVCGFKDETNGEEAVVAQAELLVKHMQQNKIHKCRKDCAKGETNMAVVRYFHHVIDDPMPVEKINVHEPNCVAALLWWRNVVDLMKTMSADERARIRNSYADPCWIITKKEKKALAAAAARSDSTSNLIAVATSEPACEQVARQSPILFGSDGYLRLDLLMKGKDVSSFSSALGEQGGSKFFRYLIAGFEDPKSFPDEKLCETIRNDNRVYCCVGLDRGLWNSPDGILEEVENALIVVPKVVAVGAVGLDYSKENVDKEEQLSALRTMCELAKSKHLPMVIDCKEPAESRDALGANRDCIKVLQEIFSAEYLFLKKSVTSFEEIHLWHEAYPNTIFGVNGLILREDVTPSLVSFLAMVDLSYIVISTDSPFRHPESEEEKNSPYSLFDVAEELGNMKGLGTAEILSKCTNTLAKFFQLK